MSIEFILYHHKRRSLADYVIQCSSTLLSANAAGKVKILSLPQQHTHAGFAKLPTSLRRLLFFARPDLVICINDGIKPIHPIFAIEDSNHVPAQDHWMQRFNNLVGCAQEGVPGAYILPFSMPNHPKFKSELDHVFFYAYDRVTEIHETPMFIAEWEVVHGKTLKCDAAFPSLPDRNSPDLKLTFQYLERVIEYAEHGRSLRELNKERLIVDLRNKIRARAYVCIPEIKDFKRLKFNMPANKPLTGAEFAAWLTPKGLTMPTDLPDRMIKRDKYLIFVPQCDRKGMTLASLRSKLLVRIDKHNAEPYIGQPLAFDYIFCRLGATPFERDISLVLDLSVLHFADLAQYHHKIWKQSPLQYKDICKIKDISTYTMYLKEGSAQVLKSVLRLYAFAADIIVYKDAIIYF